MVTAPTTGKKQTKKKNSQIVILAYNFGFNLTFILTGSCCVQPVNFFRVAILPFHHFELYKHLTSKENLVNIDTIFWVYPSNLYTLPPSDWFHCTFNKYCSNLMDLLKIILNLFSCSINSVFFGVLIL